MNKKLKPQLKTTQKGKIHWMVFNAIGSVGAWNFKDESSRKSVLCCEQNAKELCEAVTRDFPELGPYRVVKLMEI